MVTGSERKALETVSPETGETTCRLVGKKMGIDSGYARTLCGNLVRNRYLVPVGPGRYEITRLGRKALRWEHDAGPENTFERLPQEDFAWQGISPRNGNGDKPQLEKPGQEEWAWSTASIERFSDPASCRRNVAMNIMVPGAHICGYCKGKGKRANRGRCPVCGGTGEIKIPVASIRCAFCKGRGEAKPRSDCICTVCRGTGLVRVTTGPVKICPECRGRGMRVGSELPCLGCGGTGLVRGK